MHSQVVAKNSAEIFEKHREQCKLVKTQMSSNISKYELDLAKNFVKNPKGLFTYINNKQQVKESIRSLKNSSGNIT